ncbi:MAG: hypothetical protein JNL83_37765, partial [Myxococcales bacterium]|nr:hypothetical protein [Myxococcales bacterium]
HELRFGATPATGALSLDGATVVFQDIPARERARAIVEAELRRARDRLDFALGATGMGVWEWDPVADRVTWSEHLGHMIGIASPAVGKLGQYSHVLHEDNRGALIAAARRIAEEGSQLEPLSARLRRPDGTWRPVQIFAHRSAEGRVVAVFIDVTARQSLEDALRAAQKLEALGQVASGVAHDFNNLLQVILLGAQALRAGAVGELADIAADVHTAGERGVALARQLLLFSKSARFQPAAIDVNAAVRELEPILVRLVRGRATLAVDLASEVRAIWADRTQIEQLVLNLVVNARDALQRKGTITVSTSRELAGPTAYTVLGVRDDGPGVAPELQARIFEPFFTTKGTGQGTGLGLAVVQNVARQWRGRVTLESAPGQGAHFRVHLPEYASQSASS